MKNNQYQRDFYIQSSSPIERELLQVFDRADELVIMDIGSCEGEDAIRYSRLFPRSIIYAFEPLPSNQEILQSNIEKYERCNIRLQSVALGRLVGEHDFHVSRGAPPGQVNGADWNFGNKSSSLYRPNEINMPDWLEFSDTIKVTVNTLDNFCKGKLIERVDFIHLDVQGAELDVLHGACEILEKVSMIWMEVENLELYQGQPLSSDVEKFMNERGFRKVMDTVGGISGDQLYISKQFPGALSCENTKTSVRERIANIFKANHKIK